MLAEGIQPYETGAGTISLETQGYTEESASLSKICILLAENVGYSQSRSDFMWFEAYTLSDPSLRKGIQSYKYKSRNKYK